jgi:hypothetical protein
MSNHFHVVIETPRPNLVEGMRWLLGVYTSRFNRRQREFGHLFSGRYKALIVDGSGNGYLKSVCDYVHLNPARAGLLRADQPLRDYSWSSYPLYLKEPAGRPAFLRTDRLLGEWGIPKDSPAGRLQFGSYVEARRKTEGEPEYDPYRNGWCIGSQEFRQELLEQVGQLASPAHRGPEILESDVAKAQRILREELRRLGWTAEHLEAYRKGDARKLNIARRLRSETTMTLAWIARELHMGAPTHLACLLYRQKGRPEN